MEFEARKIAPLVWELGYIGKYIGPQLDALTHGGRPAPEVMRQLARLALCNRNWGMIIADSGWKDVHWDPRDGVSRWHSSCGEVICVDGEDGTWIQYEDGVKIICKQLPTGYVYLLERGAIHRSPINRKPRLLLRFS